MQARFSSTSTVARCCHFSAARTFGRSSLHRTHVLPVNYHRTKSRFSTFADGDSANEKRLPLSQVVKIHCTRSTPDRVQQWQNKSQRHATGSGFLISDRRILTNAHIVADHSFVTITKHNSGTHFPAKVTAIGHECDIAMLEIEDQSFFDTIREDEYFEFGDIPQLQDTVSVVGYPTGGDAISVTRGVVSRVEVVSYIHAAHYLLAIQIDAAINSGNSGGPAIKDGKLIGIAFQNMPDAENVGYIIPTPIIEHFLGDIERFKQYRGFCFLGIAYQSLPDTRNIHKFYRLPEHKTGILVTTVFDYSASKGIIKELDIITHIDGHEIMNDATTKFRDNESIAMEHLIANKYDQDTIDVTVWREGKEVQLKEIKLSIPRKNKTHLVPIHQYEQQSSYYVFGGCVFTVLTQPYLHTFGDEWYYYAPRDLVTEAMKGHLPCPDGGHEAATQAEQAEKGEGHGIEELIVISSVRPHNTNMGSSKFTNLILERIGDIKIKSLRHLKQVIEEEFVLKMNEKTLIDFHFRRNALMVLDIKASLLAEYEIMKRNRIPYRQSADLDEFDHSNVQQVFDRISEGKYDDLLGGSVAVETMQGMNENVVQSEGDESVVHDVHGDDHSKLVSSDCL